MVEGGLKLCWKAVDNCLLNRSWWFFNPSWDYWLSFPSVADILVSPPCNIGQFESIFRWYHCWRKNMNSSEEGKAWESSLWYFDLEWELALCVDSLLSLLKAILILRFLSMLLSWVQSVKFWTDSSCRTSIYHSRYLCAYYVVIGVLL